MTVTGLTPISEPQASSEQATDRRADRGPHDVAAAIRIVLADDHELVRRSVRALLDGEHGIDVVAEAGDLDSAIRLVRAERPGVLVLDLWMPDGSGLEAIAPLRRRQPDTQIVVLTMQDDPAFADRVFEEGAIGFVAKDLAADELAHAVRAAARGERYVSPHVASRGRARDASRRAKNDGRGPQALR